MTLKSINPPQPLRWRIGQVEIIQLVEMAEEKIFSSFIPEATPENVLSIKWLRPHFIGEKGNLKALVQSFLIKSNGKNILIDTCNGNGKDRPNVPEWGNLNNKYLEKFAQAGISPDEVDYVACTHLHFDHVGWNTVFMDDRWVPTFPHAKYLFSQAEYDYWIKKPVKEMIDDFNGLDDSVTPIIEAGLAQFIPDEYRLDENVRFFPTPGHTPHHISVAIESQGQKAIITGDVMHHPCQIAHPEWTTLADTYPEQTVETRTKFLAQNKDSNTLIIGTHFANPVAGHIVTFKNQLLYKV